MSSNLRTGGKSKSDTKSGQKRERIALRNCPFWHKALNRHEGGALIAQAERASLLDPGGTMNLDIPAHLRKHTVILADVTQVGNSDVGNKVERSGEWREGIADQRKA